MIYQGEDKTISITISDNLGSLQSIDAMTDLICYLYDSHNKTVLVKYRKEVTDGFTTLVRNSATEYIAIIPHSLTETFNITDLMIEVEIQEADGRFPDGIRRTKGKNKVTEISSSLITE